MGTTYGKLVAANIRAARARADLSGTRVIKRLAALGVKWDTTKLSRVERGLAPWNVAELFALTIVLETTLNDLVGGNTPPDAVVVLGPDEWELSGTAVRNSAYGYRDFGVHWDEDDLPSFVRPAGPSSLMANDRSLHLSRLAPDRLVRTALTVEEIKRAHPSLTRPAC